jgi:hypothetical protein
MTPEDIARALGCDRGRKAAKNWLTRCPVHDDQNPSLSIGYGHKGRIVVHCHAGCTQAEVIDALKARDLWPSQATICALDSAYGSSFAQRPHPAGRIDKARHLWASRQPVVGSPAETYLRRARGYRGPLPATLGYLPARGDHPPALIAAFGAADEPQPGVLAINAGAVHGVHLTRIAPDGSGKAATEPQKLMVGLPNGSPIALAPPNDGLGLAITEGIEDGLSIHEATGLGVLAAGAASMLPAVADAVPAWIECVTLYPHDDQAGRRGVDALARRLALRGIEVLVRCLGTAR